jgi:hypothetical protein
MGGQSEIYDLKFQIPDFKFQILDLTFPAFRFEISDLRFDDTLPFEKQPFGLPTIGTNL